MSPLRLRLVTLLAVAAFLGAAHLAFAQAEERAYVQYLFVITLGYGHLLGATLGERLGRAAPGARLGSGAGWLTRAFAAATIATGLALYVEGLAIWPGLVFVFLALSVWHITENDAAMARALRSGGGLEPLERSGRAQAPSLALAAVIVGAALGASSDPGLLADLFSATTLFHLVGWLVFLVARGASPVRLLGLHAPPFALSGLLLAWPADSWLHEWVFSPAIYLYWASLHVAHTLLRRGVAPRAQPSRGPALNPSGSAPRARAA